MQVCHFCKKNIKDRDPFCKNCGYDPKTDTVNPNFIPPARKIKNKQRKSVSMFSLGISPGVKKFVFIGLAILVFSIFYKNHFSIENVAAEVKHYFTMISKGSFKLWEQKKEEIKKIEWIDIRTWNE